MKKHIPNIITLLNMLSGTIAVIMAVEGKLITAAVFVLLGILFDFFDGFIARLLNVQGELGKQLDSLADMVTSGVVPGIVMVQLLKNALGGWNNQVLQISDFIDNRAVLPLLGLLITLGAGYRLANFNIDTRQTSSFIGVPTPATAIFILSFPLIQRYGNSEFASTLINNEWFLVAITILVTYMMNANLPLSSLKFQEYSFRGNIFKYILLSSTLILLVIFKAVAIPLIIIWYIILSIIENGLAKTKS